MGRDIGEPVEVAPQLHCPGATNPGHDVEFVDPTGRLTGLLVARIMPDPATAAFQFEYDGAGYWFCAAGCQTAFERDPEAFV